MCQGRYLLIYGMSRSSHAPSVMAIQEVGESTCTLGEVKNRADLVIFWGSNPIDSPGADMVLIWLTGYPFSVNLARGYPRYSPAEFSA
jgi:formylmethanofuran dehydrogenase subunit B